MGKGKNNVMLTAKEVAKRLGKPEISVRYWAKTGRFPGARLVETPVLKYWEIPEESLVDFQEERRGPKPKVKHKVPA